MVTVFAGSLVLAYRYNWHLGLLSLILIGAPLTEAVIVYSCRDGIRVVASDFPPELLDLRSVIPSLLVSLAGCMFGAATAKNVAGHET
jgi:hypothetical protein